jgi:RNAse (barnase) inhibitor barstar
MIEQKDGQIEEIAQAAADMDYRFFHVAANYHKHAILAALKEALHFPDYFGNNWDALADMLRDLSWLPAKGYVLLFTGFTPNANGDQDYNMILDILFDSAQFWSMRKNNRPPLIVFIAAVPQ